MPLRIKFFLGHLFLSILIALLIIFLVFGVWYPTPLAQALEVTNIFLMLLCIDVIVGPLLTLLVYKEGKKTLKMDLTVIALIQCLALLYGLYNLAQARPVWISYQDDRFELVRQIDISEDSISDTPEDYVDPSWFGPRVVAVNTQLDVEQKNKYNMHELNTGIADAFRPSRYTSFNTEKSNIFRVIRPLEELSKYNDLTHANQALLPYDNAVGWLPLKSLGQDLVVLLDQHNNIIKIVDLRPW